MKKIVIFDTSYGTFNMGDFIIVDSANKELQNILNDNFVVRIGTHNPVSHFYQNFKKRNKTKFFDNADYKFLLGTNIIKKNMLHPWPDWNVNIFNSRYYNDTILVGAGLTGKKTNLYTKFLYKKILNKEYIHSVRDEKTKVFLESLGFKAVNTGCPTLWSIDNELCNSIPKKKSKNVIFTLTDYVINREKDQELINILKNNYEKVYFWIQGSRDLEYLESLNNIENINIISPSIEAYDKFLSNNDVDYVGTRLHAGIYAIKHGKRSIILAVDNRSKDMNETYNLNVIDRNNISNLEKIINSDFETKINVNKKSIDEWKKQFI